MTHQADRQRTVEQRASRIKTSRATTHQPPDNRKHQRHKITKNQTHQSMKHQARQASSVNHETSGSMHDKMKHPKSNKERQTSTTSTTTTTKNSSIHDPSIEHHIHTPSTLTVCTDLLAVTGDHVKYLVTDLRYRQKPRYFAIFTNIFGPIYYGPPLFLLTIFGPICYGPP